MSSRQFGCITLGILWILIAAALAFLFIRDFPPTLSQLLGTGLGVLVGVSCCWYLFKAWDPANLQPVQSEDERPEMIGWLLPLSVGGGILLSSIARHFFGIVLQDVLFWSISTALLVSLGYTLVQAFRHRYADAGR